MASLRFWWLVVNGKTIFFSWVIVFLWTLQNAPKKYHSLRNFAYFGWIFYRYNKFFFRIQVNSCISFWRYSNESSLFLSIAFWERLCQIKSWTAGIILKTKIETVLFKYWRSYVKNEYTAQSWLLCYIGISLILNPNYQCIFSQ